MGGSTNTESINFTGGMNTVQAPHLINKTEAQAIVNVDIRNGALKSMPNLAWVERARQQYFVQFLGEIEYYRNFRSNATMNNNLYWANGLLSGKILYDGRRMPLGIDTPITPATVAPGAVTPNGTHTGDFKYTYTFYSSDTGVESAPAPLAPYITVDKDDIIISALEAFPMSNDPVPVPLADRYRIYRIGGYLAKFTMVAEVEAVAVPYTDSLDDTEIDGRILNTLHCGAPLDGMQDFVELNGRLFGSYGSKVYFSALGNPDAWYQSDFFILPDNITGMAKSPAGLLVFGRTYTYLLVGTAPANFRLKVLSNIIGCIGRESLSYFKENAIWLSLNGICMSTGYQVVNLTSDKIERIGNIAPTSACVVDEVYYVHYAPSLVPKNVLFPSESLYPASSTGTNKLEEGIISMDFKRGRNFSYQLLKFDNMSSIGILDGQLHSVTTVPNFVFLSCTEPLACDAVLQCTANDLNMIGQVTDFDFTNLTYISPQFIDGSLSTLKQYDKIRLNLTGEFDISVVFSNGEVVVKEHVVSTSAEENRVNILDGKEVELSRDNTVTIGIPNNNNFSYSIGFIIEGKGTVKSIQYSWKPREQQ